jgi:hypothetical protein
MMVFAGAMICGFISSKLLYKEVMSEVFQTDRQPKKGELAKFHRSFSNA